MTELLITAIYGLPLALILAGYITWQRHITLKNQSIVAEAENAGLVEPVSLHPVINTSLCVGCGACVAACPEQNVLGLIAGKSQLINPSHCIGHGACQKSCPVDAISLVFGTATRGVDIPKVSPDFETSVPGVYIAGELGGMGLIRNAIEQGRQAMEAICRDLTRAQAEIDVIIVGAGPAGIAASLAAKDKGISYLTIDQEQTLGGTVAHFPRGKLVMTQPATLPLAGKLKFTDTSKESLLDCWQKIIEKYPLNIQFGERLETINRTGNGFSVVTQNHTYTCQRVLLAIGRRGTPRQLGIPGEQLPKVVYRLIDPEQYQGKAVLVVGGGDSALEAALSIAEQPNTQVTLTYRGAAFSRAKPKNRDKITSFHEAGRLSIMLETTPLAITQNSVQLSYQGKINELANDAVIICAGGILPSGLLQAIGIEVETKYGSA